MNSVDHNPKKFDKDSYGNLIPKAGYAADETYGKHLPQIEPDKEIQNEYGLKE